MSYRNVIVTGGAGFIGSHLVDALLKAERRVTIIDDLSTGSWDNIAHLHAHPDLRIIVASAAERDLMNAEVASHDVVFHLASAVGVRLIIEEPIKTVENIVQPTQATLDACARFRRPILITSTSEVYGKSQAIPFSEDADVVMGPTEKRRWAYAAAKALDEFLALAHSYKSSLPVFIVRLFNTVGPRQTGQYGMVLPTFVHSAMAGEPLRVFGDGKQRRCFCSVRDIVKGLMKFPASAAAAGKVVNLGNDREITIEALAQRVIEIVGSQSEIQFVPYEEAYGPGFDDMMRRVPDLSRARTLIGWDPVDDLDDIIRDVYAFLQEKATGT